MGGGNLPEEEWERIFRMKRHLSDLMEQHTLADVMARERSPHRMAGPRRRHRQDEGGVGASKPLS